MQAVVFAVLLALAGCKADLYSNLTEKEANEMLAVLMSSDIDATKTRIGDTFTVQVDENSMVRAISLLSAKGYPRTQRQSIGTVFQRSGIISSPFEERVRYIYALGEEVAQTLSQIDGVVTARVHVVVPEEPQLGQPPRPASAAVFIKHEPPVDLEFLVPQIRRLVSSAIQDLDQFAVTVVLSEALPGIAPEREGNEPALVHVVPGLPISEGAVGYFWMLVSLAAGLTTLLLGAAVAGTMLFLRMRRARGSGSQVATTETGPSLEPT